MFFRPTYCSNCGEKIERMDWYPWTSRKFCQVCESELKFQDIAPKLLALISGVIIISGAINYFSGGETAKEQPRTEMAAAKPARLIQADQPRPSPSNEAAKNIVTQAAPQSSVLPRANEPETAAESTIRQRQPAIESEPIYICGAMTKKGTPCSRRVKGKGRCFQHKGMPSMLSDEQARVNTLKQ